MKPKQKDESIPWVEVDSSNVEKFRYSEALQALEVKFLRGGVYRYHPISPDSFKNLKEAESKGKWINEHLRFNQNITYRKVEE